MPDELVNQGKRIKQVKVKMDEMGTGPNLNCRMPRDERLGRASLRQMLKKLRMRSDDVGLNVEVEWE